MISTGICEKPPRRTHSPAGSREEHACDPEDLHRPAERPRQLEEHRGSEQGAQGCLRLRAEAALRLLQQPAERSEYCPPRLISPHSLSPATEITVITSLTLSMSKFAKNEIVISCTLTKR